jgi:hypothetical protein
MIKQIAFRLGVAVAIATLYAVVWGQAHAGEQDLTNHEAAPYHLSCYLHVKDMTTTQGIALAQDGWFGGTHKGEGTLVRKGCHTPASQCRPVDANSLSAGALDKLLRRGFVGHPGDSMEALYAPGC